MKRVVGIVVCVFACAMVATAGGDAMADLGFRVGYQGFQEGEGSFMGGAYLRLPWRSVVMTEGAIMYHSHDEDGVEYELIPIQLSAMVFVLRRDLDFSPYLLAGVGAYIARQIDEEDESDSDFDFGWHLGLGLDYKLSDRVFVEGDFRYIWLDLDFDDQTVSEKLSDFNTWNASVGIGFRL
ncbi:MAG: porin family protein [Kiritimatiellae bacterium]|nr:porin family protein [Kiritimatiellia bacterium]